MSVQHSPSPKHAYRAPSRSSSGRTLASPTADIHSAFADAPTHECGADEAHSCGADEAHSCGADEAHSCGADEIESLDEAPRHQRHTNFFACTARACPHD